MATILYTTIVLAFLDFGLTLNIIRKRSTTKDADLAFITHTCSGLHGYTCIYMWREEGLMLLCWLALPMCMFIISNKVKLHDMLFGFVIILRFFT